MRLFALWTMVLFSLSSFRAFTQEAPSVQIGASNQTTVLPQKNLPEKAEVQAQPQTSPQSQVVSPVQENTPNANLLPESSSTQEISQVPEEKSKQEPSPPLDISPVIETKESSSPEFQAELPKNTSEKVSTQSHQLIRRIVVFPLHTQNNYKKEADLAWWKVRDVLSEQQRFLVATKRFLSQKDSFQPRTQLKVSDVVLLSKILDSDLLITTFIESRKLTMTAYSAQDGLVLWKKSLAFNSGKPLGQQLVETSEKLIYDFLSSLPYQGYQIADPDTGKLILEEGNTLLAKIDVGNNSTIQTGQKIQWIEVERINPSTLFLDGAKYTVYAEGVVVKNENQLVLAEIKRYSSLDKLQRRSLVLFPEEAKRMSQQYQIRDPSAPEATLNLVQGELRSTEEQKSGSRSLLTALVAVANIALIILLAF